MGFLMIYQILGWPRSRTAWLANYLTYNDSMCFHEGTAMLEQKRIRTVNEYRKLFASFLEHYKHVGDANTFSLLKQKYVLPEARIVVIERNIEDVEKAIADLGFYAKIPEVIEYPYNDCLHIKYEDIDKRLGDIWEFCLPGVKRNMPRELLLRRLNVQVTNPYQYLDIKGV